MKYQYVEFPSDRPVKIKDLTDFQSLEGLVWRLASIMAVGGKPTVGDLWWLAHYGIAFHRRNLGDFVDDSTAG